VLRPHSRARDLANAVVVAVLAVALWPLQACSAQGDVGGVRLTETDPPLLVHDYHDSGMEAEITGYLRYIEGGRCFVLEQEGDQKTRNVAVWPSGSEPVRQDGALVGVNVPGFGTVVTGQWLKAGGGYVDPGMNVEKVPDVAPECLSAGGEYAIMTQLDWADGAPR